jgi:hypothetical protein
MRGRKTPRRVSTIARLIAPPFPVSPRSKKNPDLEAVGRKGRGAPDRYERQVFRYLRSHGRRHGITSVRKLGNVLIDGTLMLKDGRCLVIETKYRMGWLKACQAGWQVAAFLRLPEGRRCRPASALIIFEQFSGDWARSRKGSSIENGWFHWYTDHARIAGRPHFRLDLVRFRRGQLEGCPR